MSEHRHILTVNCNYRTMTYREAVTLVRRFLVGLREIHADFLYWVTHGSDSFLPVANDWSDLDTHLKRMARPRDDCCDEYTALDPNGDVSAETTSLHSFVFSLYTSIVSALPSTEAVRPDYTRLILEVGGSTGTKIQLSMPPDKGDLINNAVIRDIMLLSVQVWDPVIAGIASTDFNQAMCVGRSNRWMLMAKWFTYLKHPLVAACLPEHLPCSVERLADDAVLFQLTGHPPQAGSGPDMDKARRLQQLFDLYHFEHDFLLYGWPFDPVDRLYAHQITGAPYDRAYVVAFTAFDGFDAQRKVLLYAKLFRGMDNYGATIYPWLLNDDDRVSGLPIVAQARQQLSALEYVGADTPVEWHVGIEEHARAIGVLLNDIAGIPEKRLRVRYTPFVGALPAL